jgi:lipopolysaccharide export system protein LptA
MSKALFIFKISLLLLFFALTTFAYASPEDAEGREIVITSVSLVVDSHINSALFEGSVVAKIDQLTIYSDSMKVTYSSTEKKVVEVNAIGNVRVHNEGKAIFSDEAKYISEEEKIVFTGAPKVAEGENIITGTRIIYFLNDDRAVVEGSRVILKDIKAEK